MCHDGKESSAPGRCTRYVLSGLLYCGACGAPMVIYGSGPARRYKCSDYEKRGTCKNGLAVREDVARRTMLGALRDTLSSPASIAYIRKRYAEELGNAQRNRGSMLKERRGR